MPLNMPRTIRVSGRRVRLIIERAEMNLTARGVHNSSTNQIHLAGDLAPDEMRAVAVHELFHDIESVTGARLTEQDVCSMASVMFGVIRENPKFIAWLQERK